MKSCGLFVLSLLPWLAVAQPLPWTWEHSLPVISAFGSPVAHDLNLDGTQDIVLGCGHEFQASQYGVIALDGRDGQLLWWHPSASQVVTQPLFQDLNGDGVDEVFIGGRDARFWALNGSNGQPVWTFQPNSHFHPSDSGWFNFYSPQWVPDQNGDGLRDLLIPNGGDATAAPSDSLRPAGALCVLNAADGQVLAAAAMPDGRETYFSPLLLPGTDRLNPTILFGSGGETVNGALWETSLSTLMGSDLTTAQPLLPGQGKGFIAVPSLADLNGDGTEDLIVPRHSGDLIALDGSNQQVLWQVSYPGHEVYVSPTLGQFTGDATPDALAHAQAGVWPFYQGGFFFLVDGATGQVVWTKVTETYQFASPLALDWDQDGYDEIIYARNFFEDDEASGFRVFRHHLVRYDFQDEQMDTLSAKLDGMNVFSTPRLQDLNGNGLADFVYASNDNLIGWYVPDGITVRRLELPVPESRVAWGGYLGSQGDGRLQVRLSSSLDQAARNNWRVFPNPARTQIQVRGDGWQDFGTIELWNQLGQMLRHTQGDRLDLRGLPAGVYVYRLRAGDQISQGTLVLQD